LDASDAIVLVAGSGAQGFSGDGGPAARARFSTPYGVAVDTRGNVYVSDHLNGRIRKVTPDGKIVTVAGGGHGLGDGPALKRELFPGRMTFGPDGDLYFADARAHTVRKLTPNGRVATVAGVPGKAGRSGDGGPALKALFTVPEDVAFRDGNMYVSDAALSEIRKIDRHGRVTRYAGNGTNTFSGDGGPALKAGLAFPDGIAFDKDGNLYAAMIGWSDPKHRYPGDRIRKISPDGVITTVAGTGKRGGSGDGGPATRARLARPCDVAFDAQGNLYIADCWNDRVRKLALDGTIFTVAGSGTRKHLFVPTEPAGRAWLHRPGALAFDAAGNLYVTASFGERVFEIQPG
jgi:sugar lactone lactonase YvrE